MTDKQNLLLRARFDNRAGDTVRSAAAVVNAGEQLLEGNG